MAPHASRADVIRWGRWNAIAREVQRRWIVRRWRNRAPIQSVGLRRHAILKVASVAAWKERQRG